MPNHHFISHNELVPGCVIAIRYRLYKHFAIVSDCLENGMPKLISISYRTSRVQEESWHDVVADRPVEKSYINGNDPNELVLARARKCLNSDIQYNLLTFNCEHFARYVHGLPVESVQIKHTIYGAAFGAVSCMLLPKITIARLAMVVTTCAVSSLKSSLGKI